MNRWLVGLLDRIFAVSGALLFAQMPMFMLQYTQQLAGRAAELALQLKSINQVAQQNGKTLEQYIYKFISSTDPDFAQQGALIDKMYHRLSYLTQAESNLSNALPLSKPFVFIQHFDADIAKTTLGYFQMGIPFSLEGLAYALAGVGAGCLLFYLFSKVINFVASSCKKLYIAKSFNS